MSCLICAEYAETIDCAEGWEERNCPECGRYRMSQALVLTLMEQGQIFDRCRMRRWLQVQHCATAVPSVDIEDALLAS